MNASEFLPDVEFGISQPMVSAMAETEAVRYHLHVGKSRRRWLVGDQPNAADQVWVDGGRGSQGCGGATLKFHLVDGSEVEFIGPWKTGAGALFEDTGVDVRSKCLVRAVIALDREITPYPKPYRFSRVLHFDTQPVVRDYWWTGNEAKRLADVHQSRVWFSQVTPGGGVHSYADPVGGKS